MRHILYRRRKDMARRIDHGTVRIPRSGARGGKDSRAAGTSRSRKGNHASVDVEPLSSEHAQALKSEPAVWRSICVEPRRDGITKKVNGARDTSRTRGGHG